MRRVLLDFAAVRGALKKMGQPPAAAPKFRAVRELLGARRP
jgi:hypothetical protein